MAIFVTMIKMIKMAFNDIKCINSIIKHEASEFLSESWE